MDGSCGQVESRQDRLQKPKNYKGENRQADNLRYGRKVERGNSKRLRKQK